MKLTLKVLIVLSAISLVSCASNTMQVSEYMEADNATVLNGSTLGIVEPEITYSANRFAIDLRDVEITVNGQRVQLQDEYLVRVDDEDLGYIGVLDANILKKLGVSAEDISLAVAEKWKDGLSGQENYEIGFFNGFGLGNSGTISNVPTEIDYSSGFAETIFLPTDESLSYFSEVTVLDPSNPAPTDYILRTYVDISNEVIEILSAPEENSGFTSLSANEGTADGEYYVTLNALVDWELIDARTGQTIITDDYDTGFFIDFRDSTDVKLPIANGDKNAFEQFFEENDLTPYAVNAVSAFMTKYFHYMSPYFVNMLVEKTEEME